MPAYANRGGNSNVRSYKIHRVRVERKSPDFEGGGKGLETEAAIDVTFGDGRTYTYTASSCGAPTVAKMVRLAEAGQGLNSFITRVVKTGYASKS